ncbi:hypothetical protein [Singulisphaera sp. GP187]|uniref:hypothetical protein n=1 Tax=Singulisphaera sp. GP187 TaxID=1882752 RepID=UPI0020B13BA1|nr:hypothetical protein [Singulisphaera sp. GP187]
MDVRRFPGSRRQPQFQRDALEVELQRAHSALDTSGPWGVDDTNASSIRRTTAGESRHDRAEPLFPQ